MATTDRNVKALDAFKDWSNYLLVTTVAAIGWIGSTNVEFEEAADVWRVLSLASLTISMVFGVLTLALIPLVAERMSDEVTSI